MQHLTYMCTHIHHTYLDIVGTNTYTHTDIQTNKQYTIYTHIQARHTNKHTYNTLLHMHTYIHTYIIHTYRQTDKDIPTRYR
jgi:hypothetical protein